MKIQVKIKPNSKMEGVLQEGELYVVHVHERPVEGKANRALVRVLAEHFRVPQSEVSIVHGQKSRTKTVLIGPLD